MNSETKESIVPKVEEKLVEKIELKIPEIIESKDVGKLEGSNSYKKKDELVVEKITKRTRKTRKVPNAPKRDTMPVTADLETDKTSSEMVEKFGIAENMDMKTNMAEDYKILGNAKTDMSVNQSTYSSDYSFSMKHFLAKDSTFKSRDIYNYDYFVAPEGEWIYAWRKDVYKGKPFKNRIEFWQNRLIYAADLFLSWNQLRMKMDYTRTEKYTGSMHVLDDQWMSIKQDELHTLLAKNSILRGTSWHVNWVAYYTKTSLTALPTLNMGENALLQQRQIVSKMQQGLYLPEQSPYLKGCLVNLADLYQEYASYNYAKKYWFVVFGIKNITNNKQIGMRHQENNVPIDKVMTIINTRILDFRYVVYEKIKSITCDLIDLGAGQAVENTKTLTDNLGLILTYVGKINAIPNKIFSAEATNIFKTFVAGCSMSQIFRFVYDIGSYNSFEMASIIRCLIYLIYTPRQLFDAGSVQNIKAYLWKNLLGAFTQKEGSRYEHWDSSNPNETPIRLSVGGVDMRSQSSVPLNRMRTNEDKREMESAPLNGLGSSLTWEAFAGSGATGPIKDFFSYEFKQYNTLPKSNILYEGEDYMFRFDLVVNFFSAVLSFPVFHGMLKNQEKSVLIGIWKAIRNQYAQYQQFAKFATLTTNIIADLGLTQFGEGNMPVPLDMDLVELMSVTVKLNFFKADFKMKFYEVKMWSIAVKAELGMCLNLYQYYWRKGTNYAKALRTRSEVAEFLTPIIERYRVLFTTDLAKFVYDNMMSYMKVEPLFPEVNVDAYDLLDMKLDLPIAEDAMRNQEALSGYTNKIGYNVMCSMNPGKGMAYQLLGLESDPSSMYDVITRTEFITQVRTTTRPHIIKSMDDDYPCFRISPKWNDGQQDKIPDESTILKGLRDGNSVIDIDLYVKWISNAPYYNDLVQYRPPILLPLNSANFTACDESLNNVNTPDVVNFFGNEIDDVLFTSNSDINTFFEVTQLH